MAIEGDYCYTINYYYGLYIIDVSDPENLQVTSRFNLPRNNRAVVVNDGMVTVGGYYNGLRVIDATDPHNPAVIGHLYHANMRHIYGMDVVENTVYAATIYNGARIIDVSDPEQPTEIGVCSAPYAGINIEVHDNYAFLANYYRGLKVFDISDPENTELLETYDDLYRAWSIRVNNGLAFVSDYYRNIHILDVSDYTASPESLLEGLIDDVADLVSDRVLNRGQGNSLTVKLEHALARLADGRIRPCVNIINAFINEVNAHVRAGRLTAAQGQDMIDDAEWAIELINEANNDASEGVELVIDPMIPDDYFMSKSYPNPFNSTTTIEFGLPEAANVSIEVFDMNGQLVTTLINGAMSAGYHSTVWNAGMVATGTYVVSMNSNSFRSIQKVVLIK